jgi:hypothetical protein
MSNRVSENFLRPSGAGVEEEKMVGRLRFHGLRIGWLRCADAPPVATVLRPSGAEEWMLPYWTPDSHERFACSMLLTMQVESRAATSC